MPRLENSFEVPAAPEAAWDLLMDVPRVIPCMPGAELSDVVDESTWKTKMNVKLGPIALAFDTEVKRDEVDEAARRAKLSARARELRGRGGGQAIHQVQQLPLDFAVRHGQVRGQADQVRPFSGEFPPARRRRSSRRSRRSTEGRGSISSPTSPSPVPSRSTDAASSRTSPLSW